MSPDATLPPPIAEAEEALRQAMLADDVAALYKLLADDLVGVDQTGHIFDKALDLELHRSGALHISSIEFSDRRAIAVGDAWVLTVQAQLEGAYNGAAFSECFRYSRTWRRSADGWQVVFAHFSPVT